MLSSKMYLKSNSSTQFFFLFLCLLLSISTAALQLHVLKLRTLPKPRPPPLKISHIVTDQNGSTVLPHDEERGVLSVKLNDVDDLSPILDSEHLFQQRINRDVKRVERLMTIASRSINSPHQTMTSKGGKKNGFSSPIPSGISQGYGNYFTHIAVGNPPHSTQLVIDTASDLSWLQCLPCGSCYNQPVPIYRPAKSNTSHSVSCNSHICSTEVSPYCVANVCFYVINYGDGSVSTGDVRTDTLTFGRMKIDSVPIGCGRVNEGIFVGAAGILGLGRGSVSFPSHVGKIFGRIFSYCLVDRVNPVSNHSYLMFGKPSLPSKAIFTDLLTDLRMKTFYYVNLTGFSVGGVSVQLDPSVFKIDDTGGGVIIDSATVVTRIVPTAYEALRDAFRAGMGNFTKADDFLILDTCYSFPRLATVFVPTVSLHFGMEMKLKLPAANYLIPVDSNRTFCFAFAPSGGSMSVIGNIQQQGFRVVFDMKRKRIGFASKSC